jgi:cytochrome P450
LVHRAFVAAMCGCVRAGGAVCARLRAEVTQVTGGAPLRPEHVEALTYTRQVFQEALRLYPPAAITVRHVVEPFDLGTEHLTAGTRVVVPIYAIHRHQSLWEAPHVFDPERFRPEEAARRHRQAFMPFGAGPRVCIGLEFAMLEAVTVLAVLLRDLRFTSCDPSPPPPRMEITLRPARPLVMRVTAVAAIPA